MKFRESFPTLRNGMIVVVDAPKRQQFMLLLGNVTTIDVYYVPGEEQTELAEANRRMVMPEARPIDTATILRYIRRSLGRGWGGLTMMSREEFDRTYAYRVSSGRGGRVKQHQFVGFMPYMLSMSFVPIVEHHRTERTAVSPTGEKIVLYSTSPRTPPPTTTTTTAWSPRTPASLSSGYAVTPSSSAKKRQRSPSPQPYTRSLRQRYFTAQPPPYEPRALFRSSRSPSPSSPPPPRRSRTQSPSPSRDRRSRHRRSTP